MVPALSSSMLVAQASAALAGEGAGRRLLAKLERRTEVLVHMQPHLLHHPT